MSDPNLRFNLGRTNDGNPSAHLATGPDGRSRADRRRSRLRSLAVMVGLAAVVTVGFTFHGDGDGDDGDDDEPGQASPSTGLPTTRTPPAGEPLARRSNADLFSPDRQVALLPVGLKAALTVGRDDAVEIGTVLDERAALVGIDLGEDTGVYLVETGALRVDGEPLCLASVSADAATVETCDGSDEHQQWQPRQRGRIDGFRTWSLVNVAGLRLDLGGGRFFVADRGAAAATSVN